MRAEYESDISREEFEVIRLLLEQARRATGPRRLDRYDVFCGLLYVLKTGCQWRQLPKEYPKWTTVYRYFRQWNEEKGGKPSLLAQALKKCGWSGSSGQWSKRGDDLFDRGCAKREEHRYGRRERV
jgi:transposase